VGTPLSPLGALCLALAPAALALWMGRSLARAADDPLLPERLLARRRQSAMISTGTFFLLVVAWPGWAWWTVPALIVGRMAASYPLRRTLLDETWSLGAYLSFFLRLTIGVYGFWILLLLAPVIVSASGARGAMVAAALAATLVLWQTRTTDVILRLLRTRPLDHPAVVARIEQLIEAARVPAPRLEQVDLHGGVVANAVALPSLRRPAVVFSETLVDRFDADELVAIAAHELAHFEYYTRRRLRWMRGVAFAMILLATTVPLLVRRSGASVEPYWFALGAVPIFAMLASVGRHRQKHETASDVRAVELTGDPEALVRGLTKLHMIARHPRRWDPKLEQQATHPSLARRIQAIRAAAPSVRAHVHEPATFAASAGDASVTLESDRLVWREGAASAHTFGYGDLEELRIDASKTAGATLVAADRQGRRWTMALAPADLARAQAALDLVDGHLAKPVARSKTSAAIVRLLTVFACLIAWLIGQIGVAIVALLAIVRPDRLTTTAASAAALVGAAVLARDLPAGGDARGPAAAVLALFGVFLALLALQARNEPVRPWSDRLVSGLGVAAVAALALMLLGGVTPSALYQSSKLWPAATVVPLSFAMTNLVRRARGARALSGLAAGAGLLALVAGTTGFLAVVGRDPFLSNAAGVAVRTVQPSSNEPMPLTFEPVDLRVSPSGRAVLLVAEDDDERRTVHVGRSGQPLQSFDVDDGRLLDDDRALLIKWDAGATTLRVVDVEAGGSVRWETTLANVTASDIAVNSADGAWEAFGRAADHALVRVSGRVGSPASDRHEWRLASSDESWPYLLASQDDDAVLLVRRYRARLLDPVSRMLAGWIEPIEPVMTALVRLTSAGAVELARTPLDLRCAPSPAIGEAPVCASFDGKITRLFVVDVRGLQPSKAMLPGRFALERQDGAGWIVGSWHNGAVAINMHAGTSDAIRVPAGVSGRSGHLAVAGRTLAASSVSPVGWAIRIFALH